MTEPRLGPGDERRVQLDLEMDEAYDSLVAAFQEKQMPSVRAKFRCDTITRSVGSRPKVDADGNRVKGNHGYEEREPCEMWTIRMSPVYGNGDPSHENTKFWEASPGGSFEMNCVNAAAVALFDIGKEYYLDFTPAE